MKEVLFNCEYCNKQIHEIVRDDEQFTWECPRGCTAETFDDWDDDYIEED